MTYVPSRPFFKMIGLVAPNKEWLKLLYMEVLYGGVQVDMTPCICMASAANCSCEPWQVGKILNEILLQVNNEIFSTVNRASWR